MTRAPLAHPEGCPDGCHNLPGVLVGVNGCEVQRCDECAPEWSDEDAANALREAFPWIVVDFDPDRDMNGEVDDPSIGVYVVDVDRCQIPDDVPTWLDTHLLDGIVEALLAQVEGLSEQRAQRALRQALHLLLSY